MLPSVLGEWGEVCSHCVTRERQITKVSDFPAPAKSKPRILIDVIILVFHPSLINHDKECILSSIDPFGQQCIEHTSSIIPPRPLFEVKVQHNSKSHFSLINLQNEGTADNHVEQEQQKQ